MRAMGANVVRLYGWDNNANHTEFMDACWNRGVNPIYIILSYYFPRQDIVANKATLRDGFASMVAKHMNHPAILMWLIMNELNSYQQYATQMPDLVDLINTLSDAAHRAEQDRPEGPHPVSSPISETQNLTEFIMTYESKLPNMDLWALQLYRGNSFGSLWSTFPSLSSKPLLITEYGVDAWDNARGVEDQDTQAIYDSSLAAEVAANSVIRGGICSGGIVFEFVDEWWKCAGMDQSVHNTCPVQFDAFPDKAINEEWFGVVSVSKNVGGGPDVRIPRKAYYSIQSVWTSPEPSPSSSASMSRTPSPSKASATPSPLSPRGDTASTSTIFPSLFLVILVLLFH